MIALAFRHFSKKKKKDSSSVDASISSNIDALSRGSDAAREINIGLTGIDNEAGTVNSKSLQSVSAERLSSDPLERQRNIKQQAGFSAEVLDTAKRNANAKLAGQNIHYSRIDDVPGHSVNETAYDVAAFDNSGNEIPGSAAQMKFIKSNPKALVNELTGNAFRKKYPHGSYMVASDDYDAVIGLLDEKAQKLQIQLDRAKQIGSSAKIADLSDKLEYTQKVRNNLKRSELTRNEAIQARLHPLNTSAKEVLKIGNSVGVKCATNAGAISGALSLVKNVDKVIEGEMTASDAAVEVSKDTAKAAAKGYIIGQGNTVLSAALKNSSKKVLRTLGKCNAPAYAINMTISILDNLYRFSKGKLTSEQCIDEIARSGTGLVGSTAGGAIGTIGGPLGAIIGSLIGGIVTENIYGYSSKLVKSARLAHEERIIIEQECEEIYKELSRFRKQFEITYIAHTQELTKIFSANLTAMAQALEINDADSFIASANNITEELGGNVQFRNMKEFQEFMNSNEPFDL